MEQHRGCTEKAITDLPARDETAALEAAAGDADLARELVESLVRGLPKELSGLQRCFAQNDWSLLAEAAHRMRGATSYCGVPAIDNCLQELERVAKTGDREGVRLGIERVEQEMQRLTNAVRSQHAKDSRIEANSGLT